MSPIDIAADAWAKAVGKLRQAAPIRHDKVIQAFGRLATDRGDEALIHCARSLRLVLRRREVADYEGSTPGADEARDTLETARRFLSVCAGRYGFPPP
ncbi:hypothetical protein [Rhodocista pekingensis]|uniref:HEPN domain-containing protein n=1 Tax=Rhodocista pekingensis TaxID=201185 RepID=A0ABW2KTP4_9PROT